MTTLFDPRRRRTDTRPRLARGDLHEDIDRDLTLDLRVTGALARRVRPPTSDADIERAVEALVQGIAADYPKLLEHSRRTAGDPQIDHLDS